MYEISKLYAEDIAEEIEMTICLSSSEWEKFQAQDFYQELIQFLDDLEVRDTERKGDNG